MCFKNLILILAICSVVLLSLPQAAQAVEVHGHRGSRGTHPENTLPAFQEALEAGVDVLELDLGMTKDNVLILSHDPVINKEICQTMDGQPIKNKIVLREALLKDLKKLDCGGKINPKFPQQKAMAKTKLPTLEELFVWLKKSQNPRAQSVHLNIETKFDYKQEVKTATPKEYATALAKLLKKHQMVDRVIIQSFDFRSLEEIRKIIPKTKVSMLVYNQKFEDLLPMIKKLKPNVLSPNFQWLKPEVVNQLQKMKIQVIPWTVNDEAQWKKMMGMKVNGIITDYPRKLRSYLKSNKKK